MAEPSPPHDLTQRYRAVEAAYRDDRWPDVILEGQTLLNDLHGAPGDDNDAMGQRLRLLMAHAHLYGFADRGAAESLYRLVLASGADASLHQIANEGLMVCAEPLAITPPQVEPKAKTEIPKEAPTPWLSSWKQPANPMAEPLPFQTSEELASRGTEGLPRLVPDVVDEPEMIEVHQADPQRAFALDVQPRSGGGYQEQPPSAEDPELLNGLLRVVIR